MKKVKKLTLLLVLVLVSSGAAFVSSGQAQTSVSKPAVPQFSLQVVDYSYDVPTSYYTDPYTGQQVANPGYHVADIRVEGKIKNQPFSPYIIPNPNATSRSNADLNIDFYYSIRYKGHFGDEWRQLDGTRDVDFLKQNYGSEYSNFTATRYNAFEFQEGSQIDFQVKAVIGFETWGFVATFPYRMLNGEDSGWSNTLSVTISQNTTAITNAFASSIDSSSYPILTLPQSSPTTTPTPATSTPSPVSEHTITPNAQNPQTNMLTGANWEQTAIIALAAAVAVLSIVLFAVLRKKNMGKPHN
jgi:hypothetical protein